MMFSNCQIYVIIMFSKKKPALIPRAVLLLRGGRLSIGIAPAAGFFFFTRNPSIRPSTF